MALVEQSKKDNTEIDDGGIESMDGSKAAEQLFTNDLDLKAGE